MNPHIAMFFADLGIPTYDAYGLTRNLHRDYNEFPPSGEKPIRVPVGNASKHACKDRQVSDR